MYPTISFMPKMVFSTYQIIIFGAFIASTFVSYHFLRMTFKSLYQFIEFQIVFVITGLVGAKVFHTVFEASGHQLSNGRIADNVFELLSDDLWHWLDVFSPGFVIYGFIIFSSFASYFYVKPQLENEQIIKIFNTLGPMYLFFGVTIGRIACFFAGCCYGQQTQSNFAIYYPITHETYGSGRLPIQLFESVSALILLYLILKIKQKWPKGVETYLLSILAYATLRFVTEFFRDDISRGLWINDIVSTSQIISILLITTFILIWCKKIISKG